MFKKFGNFIMTQRGACKDSPWLFSMMVFVITESLFLILKILGLKIHGPVIPMSFGLIKDLADVVLVVLFPWDGWVFAVLSAVIFTLGTRFKYLIATYFLSTISTAFISAFFNFHELSVKKIGMGILTYAAINAFVFVFVLALVFLLKLVVRGISKCRQ